MKITLEQPFYYCNDPEVFNSILLSICFKTGIWYFHNKDSGYKELALHILGFGIRLKNQDNN